MCYTLPMPLSSPLLNPSAAASAVDSLQQYRLQQVEQELQELKARAQESQKDWLQRLENSQKEWRNEIQVQRDQYNKSDEHHLNLYEKHLDTITAILSLFAIMGFLLGFLGWLLGLEIVQDSLDKKITERLDKKVDEHIKTFIDPLVGKIEAWRQEIVEASNLQLAVPNAIAGHFEFNRGNYLGAVALFDLAINHYHNSELLFYWRASANLYLYEWVKVGEDAVKMIELNDKSIEGHVLLATVAACSGEKQNMDDLFEMAISFDRNNAFTYYEKAMVLTCFFLETAQQEIFQNLAQAITKSNSSLKKRAKEEGVFKVLQDNPEFIKLTEE